MGLKEAEDIDFKFTTMSLNTTYKIGFKQALENIKQNGGKISGDLITIPLQSPATVRFEKSFEGHYPSAKIPGKFSENADEISFDFEGVGFVLKGDVSTGEKYPNYVYHTELYIDGKLVEKPELPLSFTTRRHELAWKYNLPKGKHTVRLKILNVKKEHPIKGVEAIIYTDKPVDGLKANLGTPRKI
jgi:hypothetical protein